MNATRIVIWPILLISYATLFVAMIHVILGNWSGAANLGALFVVFIGAPSLAGYTGHLWRQMLLRGWVRTEAALCAAVSVAILPLLAAVALIPKSRSAMSMGLRFHLPLEWTACSVRSLPPQASKAIWQKLQPLVRAPSSFARFSFAPLRLGQTRSK